MKDLYPAAHNFFIPFSFRKRFQIPESPLTAQGRSEREYDWRVNICYNLDGLS